MNDAANIVKLNRHLLMDAEIINNERMVCKTCNRSVSLLKTRSCHESLGTNLVLRCNNNRCTSGTYFHSTHKSESKKSYQISTVSRLGMRAL